MTTVYLSPGKRTPFVKAGTSFAKHDALELSTPVAQAMTAAARPDFMIWGQVIPDPTLSNIARELAFAAKLDPEIPAFSTVLACSTSFIGMIEAAGMVGRGGNELAMVGGVETMTHVPIAIRQSIADGLIAQFATDPAGAVAAFGKLTLEDFNLPTGGWTNRVSGRSMGQHTEDTAKFFGITRLEQDEIALKSHQGALRGWADGFFAKHVVPFDGVERDSFPRPDTSLERLGKLKPVFDTTSGEGTLTAGNSTPLTDGAAGLWVGTAAGIERLGGAPAVELVDWEVTAIDFRTPEGMLMAPARAIPRLLARHGLTFGDVDLWELHEAFAAQVAANIKAASDPVYRREKAKVDVDLGDFPWERLNPYGGSLAIGHPFAATGARILSQAAAELAARKSGALAIVSVCADGGHGTVALLRNP